jgi:hypothetical protein
VDVRDASGDLCPLGGGEGVVDHVWDHSVGPVVPEQVKEVSAAVYANSTHVSLDRPFFNEGLLLLASSIWAPRSSSSSIWSSLLLADLPQKGGSCSHSSCTCRLEASSSSRQ